MNLLQRLQEFGEDIQIDTENLMRYHLESKELSKLINETKKNEGYCTQIKLNGMMYEWLNRTGYMRAEGIKRLKELGYSPSNKLLKKGAKLPNMSGRTELGSLIMNTYRVGMGGRKLPGVTRTITIEYDGDGDTRWPNLYSALTMVKAEYDVWHLLETLSTPGAMLGIICNDNPSPPMRAILEKRSQE